MAAMLIISTLLMIVILPFFLVAGGKVVMEVEERRESRRSYEELLARMNGGSEEDTRDPRIASTDPLDYDLEYEDIKHYEKYGFYSPFFDFRTAILREKRIESGLSEY